jgi:hypothetical protein
MTLPPRAAPAALLALALLAGTGEAHSQGWVLDASAGRIVHEPVSATIGTTGASLGLRHDGPWWLYLSGGVPFDSAGSSWGALGVGARLSSGGFLAVGIDAGAHAYGYRDATLEANGGGATLEAMPLLSVGAGPVRLETRSGLLHHTRILSGEADSRSVHASDARLSVGSALFQVSGEGRYLRAAEGSYPYAGAAFEAALDGGGALWGYAGKWLSEAIETPVWGGGARLGVGGRVEVYASFQQETNDPLYGNAPRRSWSLGVSHRLGRPAPSAPASLAPEVGARGVTFRIPLAASSAPPSLGGDFTRWEAVPMAREGGVWTVTLPVAPGIHRYAFRSPGGDWFVPESVPGRTDDGFGGVVSTLIVP